MLGKTSAQAGHLFMLGLRQRMPTHTPQHEQQPVLFHHVTLHHWCAMPARILHAQTSMQSLYAYWMHNKYTMAGRMLHASYCAMAVTHTA